MTSIYNVYRVYFTQRSGLLHVEIALVPAQLDDQGKGRFYHVKGNIGLGMDYDSRAGYGFEGSRSFSGKSYVFQLPMTKLAEFELIAAQQPPPHDARVLTEWDPDSRAPECKTWVEAVLAAVEQVL